MFAGKQAEGAERVRAALLPALVAGEEFRGSFFATRKSAFSGKIFALGATDQRLVMLELDRKFTAKGAPITIRPSDITKSSIDGYGGGAGHFAASLGSAPLPEIRFDTANEKYRFAVLGGLTGDVLMGTDYMAGLDAGPRVHLVGDALTEYVLPSWCGGGNHTRTSHDPAVRRVVRVRVAIGSLSGLKETQIESDPAKCGRIGNPNPVPHVSLR